MQEIPQGQAGWKFMEIVHLICSITMQFRADKNILMFLEVKLCYGVMKLMQKVYSPLHGPVVLLLLNVYGLTFHCLKYVLKKLEIEWLFIVSVWETVELVLKPSSLSTASRTRIHATHRNINFAVILKDPKASK